MSSLPPFVLAIPPGPASAAGEGAVRFPPPPPPLPPPPPFFTTSLLLRLLELLSFADPLEEMEEALLAVFEAIAD